MVNYRHDHDAGLGGCRSPHRPRIEAVVHGDVAAQSIINALLGLYCVDFSPPVHSDCPRDGMGSYVGTNVENNHAVAKFLASRTNNVETIIYFLSKIFVTVGKHRSKVGSGDDEWIALHPSRPLCRVAMIVAADKSIPAFCSKTPFSGENSAKWPLTSNPIGFGAGVPPMVTVPATTSITRILSPPFAAGTCT